MKAPAAAPRPIGALLDNAIRLVRANVRATLPLCLGYAALGLVPFLVLSLQLGHLSISATPMSAAFYGLLATTTLVGFLRLGLYASLWVWYLAQDQQQSLSVRETLLRGVRLIPRQWLAILLFLGIIVVVAVPCFVVVVLISLIAPGSKALIGFLMLTMYFGAVAFFGIRYFALTGAMVLEGCSALGSLKRSWQLTSGHWWRCFAVSAVYWLMYFLVIFVVASGVRLIANLLGGGGLLDDHVRVIQLLLGPWLDVFYVATCYFLYLDLRARKEGDDLAAQVERLTA